MTGKELKAKNTEWLATVKIGDEVCFTNSHDFTTFFLGSLMRGMGGGLFGAGAPFVKKDEPDPVEICEILTVRGILEDGSIIAGDKIFTAEGTIEGDKQTLCSAALWEPTAELRTKSWRLRNCAILSKFDFSYFNDEDLLTLIGLANSYVRFKDKVIKAYSVGDVVTITKQDGKELECQIEEVGETHYHVRSAPVEGEDCFARFIVGLDLREDSYGGD